MTRLSTLFTALFACATAATSAQSLVKDIIPGLASGYPNEFCSCNGTLYFVAEEQQSLNGEKELWKTDGTAAGTVQVKDINPSKAAIPYSGNFRLRCMNNQVYFFANDGVNGTELWKSDGTNAGTVMVKDINPGSQSGYPTRLHVMNGALYFIAEDGTNGRELWKSDGTPGGTNMLRDILPGQYGESSFTKADFAELDGLLYFESRTATNGLPQLWRTDGTELGTVMVKDSMPGHMDHLTAYNGNLIFSVAAQSANGGNELYISDGTAEGTHRLKDINTGNLGSNPADFTLFNNNLFFIAISKDNGAELWSTDGTEAGTAMVKDIRPGTSDGVKINSKPMTVYNNHLYFGASDGNSGAEVWKTDGTEAGTVMLKDINTGVYGSTQWGFTELMEYKGDLYFAANTNQGGTNEIELWKTDGTENGTTLVKNICPNHSGSPSLFHVHNDILFFSADDCSTGQELWKYDGTDGSLSIGNELASRSPAAIYPNPANGFITIESRNSANSTFRIFTLTGQTLLTGNLASSKTKVDISALPSGIYIIETGAVQKHTSKLIVQ